MSPVLPGRSVRSVFFLRALTRRFCFDHRLLFLFHSRPITITEKHSISLRHHLLHRVDPTLIKSRLLPPLRPSRTLRSHLIYPRIHRVSYPRARQISRLFQLVESSRFDCLTRLWIRLRLESE